MGSVPPGHTHQGRWLDWWGNQQLTWAPGCHFPSLHLRALIKGRNWSQWLGTLWQSETVGTFNTLCTQSTILASSLMKVPCTSKEGIQGILSELPAWAGHQGCSRILCVSSFKHTWDGTTLLPLKLRVACDFLRPMRHEQKQQGSLCRRVKNPCLTHCPLSRPQWQWNEMQLLPALSPNEQNTYYITRGAGARDKLLCVRSLGFGDSLSLEHTLVIPDRYHGPVPETS